MKNITFIALLFCTGFIYGQTQIENGGFEDPWEDVDGSEDEPAQWSSLKTADALGGLAPIVVFQSEDAHSGTYSARLKNASLFGIVANGIMSNGRIHADLDAELGYVFTNEDEEDWSLEFEDRPDSLVAWYKYSPIDEDRGKIQVLLHTNADQGELPESGSTAHWVGEARHDMEGSTDVWTRLSVPFDYYTTGSPNYALVVVTSGDSTAAVEGSEMWIDDIELIYNDNSVSVTPEASQNIFIDEDGDLLTVEEIANAAVVDEITREWKYSETPGSDYISFVGAETGLTYLPNFDTPGIYYVICETDFGTEVLISNEVEIIVTDPAVNSVTVSPSADQSILMDEDGIALIANEAPIDPISREWKYSETEGAGHIAFDPAETAVSYTPNFDAISTYYVICESDFGGGDIAVSNEVTIIVAGAAGIHDENIQFEIYSTTQGVQIQLNNFEGATLKLFALDGKEIYRSGLTSENTFHSILESGVFIYQIVKGAKIITGKIHIQ